MTSFAPRNDHHMLPAKAVPPARPCVFSGFICVLLWILTVTAAAHAGLTPIKDTDMDAIWGTAGIMITPKNIQIFHHIDVIRYCADAKDIRLDNGYIEFQDFMMHGAGDVARFNYDFGSVTKSGIMLFDVAEPEIAPVNDWSGNPVGDPIHRGMTMLRAPDWDQEMAYTIGNIRFSDPDYPNYTDPVNAPWVDLGSFTIGLIDMPRFYYYTSPSVRGTGFDYQYNFQMTIDAIGYAYNTGCDTLEFGPIYIGESFADLTGDDPRFPSTWKPNQATAVDFGEFRIGDLFGDMSDVDPANWVHSNPAGFNAGECDLFDNGEILGALQMSAPMQGSIRFENAVFDGIDFGPGAIDGMQVHRLELFLIP